MEKCKRAVGVFLIIAMLSCCGCSLFKEALPEETIEDLEDAVNEMDLQAMLDCIDSGAISAAAKGADLIMNITGKVTGLDLGISMEDLLAMLPIFQVFIDSNEDMNDMPQVDFTVTETYIKGEKATVYFTEVNSGEECVLNMKKKKGKWLITMDVKRIEKEDADRVIIPGEDETEETQEDNLLSFPKLPDMEEWSDYLNGILEKS